MTPTAQLRLISEVQKQPCCCLMKRSLTLHSSTGEMWSDETKNYQERTCRATSALNGAQAYSHENIVPQSNPVYCIRAWTACTHSGDGWIWESIKNILYDSSTVSVHWQKVCKIWVMQQNKTSEPVRKRVDHLGGNKYDRIFMTSAVASKWAGALAKYFRGFSCERHCSCCYLNLVIHLPCKHVT